MAEILQGRPLPSSQQRQTWKTGSQVSRGGKLIDVEIEGAEIGGATITSPNISGGTITSPDINGGTIDDVTIDGGWQTFTPTLIAATTSPTLGTGSSAVGRYQTIGNLCIVHIQINFGSAATNAGSGSYSVRFASAPAIAAASGLDTTPIGQGFLTEAGAALYNVVCLADTSNYDRVALRADVASSDSNQAVTHAAPFAWGAGDKIRIQLMYEIA